MKKLVLTAIVLMFVSCDITNSAETEEFIQISELQATEKQKSVNSNGSGQGQDDTNEDDEDSE